MPDETTLLRAPVPPYAADIEARVAVLEQIAKDTKDILTEMKQDIRGVRQEIKEVRQDQRSDFPLLFGAIIAVALGLAGLMARGFHWL